MRVVSKGIIQRRLALRPYDLKGLVITPLQYASGGEPGALDSDSIDLRLGSRFLVPRAHHLGALRHGPADPETHYRADEAVHIPPDEEITIPAHGTVLGATLEYLKLPYDFSGQVLTRSSLARKSITIETAPLVASAGANVMVAGSAVFKGGTQAAYAENIAGIRAAADGVRMRS